MTNSTLLQGIDTLIIRVSDITASSRWYQDNVGLKLVWEDTAMKLVVLDTGGPTSLTLWQTDQKIENKRDTAAYPIFRTPHAEAARTGLLKKGVRADEIIDDGTVRYFQFFDPDNNVLEACQVHE